MKFIRFLLINILFVISTFHLVNAKIIKKFSVIGNDRIADETIILFSKVNLNKEINEENINTILKNLYKTNYFKNVSLRVENETLIINVVEQPLVQNILFRNIKSENIINQIKDIIVLKERSSYNEFQLENDIRQIKILLQSRGYYFSEISALATNLEDNLIDLTYDIKLGDKAKISSIVFNGNKIFKDNKLRGIITSEEYKFWKFISGKKYLNENLIKFDERLLRNFYLNKGYPNVEIYSSFAKLVSDSSFQLFFNINANEKIYFNEFDFVLPKDYNIDNFSKIYKTFEKIKGTPYSINSIDRILNEIDNIIIEEQFESITATVEEEIFGNKINLKFSINDTEKLFVERINILGNNITDEKVIRNQLLIDEGDPYNEILGNKSINNIKNLNFFKSVNSEVLDSKVQNNKIINITVEEKATGEILAGAGVGTNGGTMTFAVKENNFQGQGIGLKTSLTVSEEDIKGIFSVTNPNFRNSDKSIYTTIESTEVDRLEKSGYKTNKTGFVFGTDFEYLDDLNFGLGVSNYYERISTDSTASTRQQKQKGNYWDSFVELDFIYDKRNQKFQTTKGYVSKYSISIPAISDTNSFTNYYSYKIFKELYEDNVSSFGITLNSAFTLNDNDIKLSERLFVPSKLLRGFETGKIGPKDGNDFIGGNYLATINFSSTLPQVLPNLQNTDVVVFFDLANLWGVDYDSSLSELHDSSFRASLGLGLDWFSPIGPMNFSLAQPILKENTDITESFRFNIGTTF